MNQTDDRRSAEFRSWQLIDVPTGILLGEYALPIDVLLALRAALATEWRARMPLWALRWTGASDGQQPVATGAILVFLAALAWTLDDDDTGMQPAGVPHRPRPGGLSSAVAAPIR